MNEIEKKFIEIMQNHEKNDDFLLKNYKNVRPMIILQNNNKFDHYYYFYQEWYRYWPELLKINNEISRKILMFNYHKINNKTFKKIYLWRYSSNDTDYLDSLSKNKRLYYYKKYNKYYYLLNEFKNIANYFEESLKYFRKYNNSIKYHRIGLILYMNRKYFIHMIIKK